MRQGQFDIVHLHDPEAPSVSHKPLVMHDAPPLVATFHASIEPYPRALNIFERYLRSYLTPLSRAIFVSPSAGRTADHYLPEDIGRTVIPNGFDRSAYLRATPNAQWQGTAEHPTIGVLGRLEEERKGFPVFVDAAQKVLRQYPGARFLVVGDGRKDAENTILEREDGEGLLEHFEFLGRVDDDDKARFYKSLDVYVAPQTGGESFGRKGFPVFVDAAQQVLRQYPGARFLVVGDGRKDAEKTILEREDGEGLLEHFEFLGRVEDDDKARFYKSLDVYVAPQTGGESFGIVLAEAMAAGCAIVASDLPAFVDVTEQGQDAALFANKDGHDCAARICELLADDQRRERLATAGLKRSQDFDWETVVDEVLAVYRQALS